MASPILGDKSRNGVGKSAAFGSVGMSMALPKSAGGGTLGTCAASQAFKRPRAAAGLRCQDGRGAEPVDEQCVTDLSSSVGTHQQVAEQAAPDGHTAEERCPMCHQLTFRPRQEASSQLASISDTERRSRRMQPVLKHAALPSHELMMKGGLLLAAYMGHMALRWAIRKRRRRDWAEHRMDGKAPEMKAEAAPLQARASSPHSWACNVEEEDDSAHSASPASNTASPALRPANALQAVAIAAAVQKQWAARSARRQPQTQQPGTAANSLDSVYHYARLALQQPRAPARAQA